MIEYYFSMILMQSCPFKTYKLGRLSKLLLRKLLNQAFYNDKSKMYRKVVTNKILARRIMIGRVVG